MALPTSATPFIPLHQTFVPSLFSSNEHYANALFVCTNEASHTLVHCPRHLSQIPSSFSTSRKFSWCIMLHCDICETFWSVCSVCPAVRIRMVTKKQCNRHNSIYHSSELNPHSLPTAITNTARTPTRLPPANFPSPNQPQRLPFFSRMESQNYFMNNRTGNLGPASLVSMAHFKKREYAHLIPPQHVFNQILMAQHAADLTKGQKKNFAYMLQNLMKTMSQEVPATIPYRKNFVLSLPITFSEIRNKLTEGPQSIVKNLPYPSIQTDVPGHSYVKISDVIEDFLAHGSYAIAAIYASVQ